MLLDVFLVVGLRLRAIILCLTSSSADSVTCRDRRSEVGPVPFSGGLSEPPLLITRTMSINTPKTLFW